MKRLDINHPCTITFGYDGTVKIESAPVPARELVDPVAARLSSITFEGRLAFTEHPWGAGQRWQFADAGDLAHWLLTGNWQRDDATLQPWRDRPQMRPDEYLVNARMALLEPGRPVGSVVLGDPAASDGTFHTAAGLLRFLRTGELEP